METSGGTKDKQTLWHLENRKRGLNSWEDLETAEGLGEGPEQMESSSGCGLMLSLGSNRN